MKNILLILLPLTFISAQIEFNDGPYGSEYFDIAGPFTLVDLNLELGDVNSDNTVNILDIIATVNYVLGYDDFSEPQELQQPYCVFLLVLILTHQIRSLPTVWVN